MILRFSGCVGAALMHFETGEILGLIQDIIIRPEDGKIEAFWVKSVEHPFKNLVIQTQDIVEWKKNVYLKDRNSIAEPGEIIRISQILEKGIYVIGSRVVTEEEKYLGKVYDLDFSTDEFVLRNIYVEKRFLWCSCQKRIIGNENIIEILQGVIKVREIELEKESVPLKETVLET